VAAGGSVIGPVFGGLLVGYLSWRWIFFVNVPIGILLLFAIVLFVPASEQLRRSRMDVRGLVMMIGFVLALSLGITSIGNAKTTFADPTFLVPTLAGLALLGAFLRHTVTVPEPFIPVRLLRARGFAVMNVMNILWGGMGFGIAASLTPLYAEQRYHLKALDAGTLLTARGIGALAVGALAAMSLRRTGYRLPLIVGFGVSAIGTALMAIYPLWGISPYTWLAVGAGISGLGNGTANPASRNALLQVAPNDVAAVTGLRQMFAYIGIIFSVSIATAILNRSGNPGLTQVHLLWVVVGVLIFVLIPLAFRVPEHKGSW
jgi:MFS family permease